MNWPQYYSYPYWSGYSAPPPYSFGTAQQYCVPLPTTSNAPVIPLPTYWSPWPYPVTPLPTYSQGRQRVEPVPPSPEPYLPGPYYRVPPSPAFPYLEHTGGEPQADFGWNPYGARPPRRRAARVLRRKSSFHSPSKPKSKRLRGPLRSPWHLPSYDSRFTVKRPIEETPLDSLNLAPRPDDWRVDYTPPRLARRLSRCFSRRMRRAVDKIPTDVHYTLSPLIHYTSRSTHPISYDIRLSPSQTDVQFLNFLRPSNEIDLFQLATSPPVNELCLYHPRLPWYIHVCASQSNGVTIGDILTQIHDNLAQPINWRDFYNEALNASDREEMSTAFYYRRGEDTEDGMLRMDFLGFDVSFLGLSRTKHGIWEIKTAEATP